MVLNNIQKSAPVLNGGALWTDEAKQTFFASMGAVSESLDPPMPVPPEQVWE